MNDIVFAQSNLSKTRANIWTALANAANVLIDFPVNVHVQKISKNRWIKARRRSNGIEVSQGSYDAMKAANKARDAELWHDAALFFAQAADLEPTLPHIWMQLGHAHHMSGSHLQGQQAYLRAAILDPLSGEAYVHALQWAASINDIEAAVDFSRAACLYEDSRDIGLSKLKQLRPALHDLILKAGNVSVSADDTKWSDILLHRKLVDNTPPILRYGFDVSDLIAHYKNNKFPTGIQRVQIEVIESYISTGSCDAGIFFFVDGRNELIEISSDLFILLARISRTGSFDEWARIRKVMFEQCAYGKPFDFSRNMVVINLGTSWWMYNYFLQIRNLKRKKNIKFISYVHDLIPVLAPEHCVAGVTIDYITWLIGAYQHSDAFITNSQSTTDDLLFTLRFIGHKVSDDIVKAIPLNASLSGNSNSISANLTNVSLSKYGILPQFYVLFVSTIESRKNHELAFSAWELLGKRRGYSYVPQLVCVGKDGWLNERAHAVINRNPSLKEKITFITKVNDEELKALYIGSKFTIYPSHYEGWGLPITESLSFGRVPLYADNSSLTEAGAGFGVSFESNNVSDLVIKIERLIDDGDYIAQLENDIERNYRPVTWEAMASEIISFSNDVSSCEFFPRPGTQSILGKYIPVSLSRSVNIWKGIGSGEIFRQGDGWLWPDDQRCRIKPGQAQILIQNIPCTIARVFIHLCGLDSKHANFVVRNNDSVMASGCIGSQTSLWAVFDATVHNGFIEIYIESHESEIIEVDYGGSKKVNCAGIGILGFTISDSTVPGDRLGFLESVLHNRMETSSLYRRI